MGYSMYCFFRGFQSLIAGAKSHSCDSSTHAAIVSVFWV
jgi:hypothetical protein